MKGDSKRRRQAPKAKQAGEAAMPMFGKRMMPDYEGRTGMTKRGAPDMAGPSRQAARRGGRRKRGS